MLRTFTTKPIFIGGDGRSGTTLLSVVLDSHPILSVGPELHFNGPRNLGSYALECTDLIIAKDPKSFGKGLKKNKQYKFGVQFAKRCHRFGLDFSELRQLIHEQMDIFKSNLSSFEERCGLINAIGEHMRVKTGKQRWGIKIMREIRNIHLYGRIWPDAQFIHIVRDGRDVAASQMVEHGSWGYNDIKKAAKGWVDIIERTRRNSIKGFSFYEIKYEDIVINPENTLSVLTKYLGIPWDEGLLKHNQVEHSLFHNPYNHASIDTVIKPINSSAVGRYKKDLTIDQIISFNSIAGDLLKSLGYEI